MIDCPDKCQDGTHYSFDCGTPRCICDGFSGGCETEEDCETCYGRGTVCDCGRGVDDDADECEDCER